jgi:hypothetical protein
MVKDLNDDDTQDKKNIIRVKNKFVFRKHLVLAFEIVGSNLYELIKSNNY